jgi:hypothetical protein
VRRREADPAALGEPFIGLLESRRGGDAAVLVAVAALLVADAIERREHVLTELCRLREHRFDEVGRGVGETRQVVEAFDMEHVAQEKHHVVDGSLVGRH